MAGSRYLVLKARLLRMIGKPRFDQKARPARSRESVTFEALESRLLLSADLTGAILSSTLPAGALPGDTGAAVVDVSNRGNTSASADIRVDVYASLDNVLDSHDRLLGTQTAANSVINPAKNKSITVPLLIPADLVPDAVRNRSAERCEGEQRKQQCCQRCRFSAQLEIRHGTRALGQHATDSSRYRWHRCRFQPFRPRFRSSDAARRAMECAADRGDEQVYISGKDEQRRRRTREVERYPDRGLARQFVCTDIKAGWTGRVYEDFEVGDVYRHPLGRTITQTDNIWFTLLTQNTAPLHFDAYYAAQTEFKKPLVNSALTIALVTGQTVTDISQNVFANLGWDEVRLPNPVFEGDTLYSQ